MSETKQTATNQDLKTAIQRTMEMIDGKRPDLAEQQALEILKIHPGEVNTLYALGKAQRLLQKPRDAEQHLREAIKKAPDFALPYQELGLCLQSQEDNNQAITYFEQAVNLQAKLAQSWLSLGELYLSCNEQEKSEHAFQQHLKTTSRDPELIEAIEHTHAKRYAKAERTCRSYLKRNPKDVSAIRLLADIGIQLEVYDDAIKLLERCLELAPDFDLARLNYARALSGQKRATEALEQIEQLEQNNIEKVTLQLLKANCLGQLGKYDDAIATYEKIIAERNPHSKVFTSYGHALKTFGRTDDAIQAYRKAIAVQPTLGEAYWSLANLKTFRFEDSDLYAMKEALETKKTDSSDVFHMCFSLGKALEDKKNYQASFKYYALGNKIKKHQEGYSADENHSETQRKIASFSRDLFTKNAGNGCQQADPIFIVGLPRSGSTLLEQIIASHSMVDGTKELPDITAIARNLGERSKQQTKYPEILHDLSADQLKALGEEYLVRTRPQRQNAPYFIDKMPNNFAHIGLIKLILPNAKIIDARRHPMDSCFSGFKQLFAAGQRFTYGLEDIGRYFSDYVALMDHWDQVLPGEVYLAQYEETVANTEQQVRNILDFLGLPFEENCLQFHKTERAVRTASSEQVRQPIYKSAVAHWKNFEQDLDELKQALEPVRERYPLD